MAYMGMDEGQEQAESLSIKTRCRLCSNLFEEPLLVEDGRAYLAGRTGIHPSEDGSPWCAKCRATVDTTARRLLADIELVAAPALPLVKPALTP